MIAPLAAPHAEALTEEEAATNGVVTDPIVGIATMEATDAPEAREAATVAAIVNRDRATVAIITAGLRQPPRSALILLPRNSRLSFFRKKERPRASQTRSARVPERIRSLARRDCFWKNLRDTSSESPVATHRSHFFNSTMARLALKES